VPIQAVTGPIDLFHSPDFVLPPVAHAPALLTVHDLSFLRVPEHFVPGFRSYLEAAVSRATVKAHHILADSNSTRCDLVELMGVDPDKITVLYPGVEKRFTEVHDPRTLATVTRRYELPTSFILGLGTLQPRKNFRGLIQAFQQLIRDSAHKQEFTALHLVICGGSGWMYQDILDDVERRGLQDRVHIPGFVRDEDLPALYTLAKVFAFPSWYEGFGLPILEAQACGTPVVAADNSSLPEVVGDAGLLVDAADTEALARALGLVLTDHSLRSRLVSAGRVQAARFTWEHAAKALLATYQNLASPSL